MMNLLTRSDFDGLACAALLRELGVIGTIKFVHPKDIQDGIVEVTEKDVLANIPYVEGCGLWFDHHSSETERLGEGKTFKGDSRLAPSAARVVYEYYGGQEKLPQFELMVSEVDKVDSGNLSIDEILNPKGWVLLGFIQDPRTGLGRFREFRISNYALMEKLIDMCRTQTINEILKDPDVKERVDMYFKQDKLFREMIKEYTTVYDNAIVTDLRGVDPIYTGNRFLIYSLFPDKNISLWVVDGRDKKNCSIAVGHSIINRSSSTDVGSLLLKYGGGGHRQVGTCQVLYGDVDKALTELVEQINIDG